MNYSQMGENCEQPGLIVTATVCFANTQTHRMLNLKEA